MSSRGALVRTSTPASVSACTAEADESRAAGESETVVFTADNGEIVAAMLDGEATVKTFRQRDGHTWLLPRNSAFEPILGDDATVLGKVVAVLRAV